MSATEIILIVIGIAIFLLGYLMPARRKDLDEEVQLISEDEVRKLVAGETEHVKDRIADIVDETVNYSIEKAERAMERVTNEKIMAINEYSDTVLEEINKNHKEVVFLYDMLNDKHDNLMSTINEATMAADEIKQTVRDAELIANDAADKVDAVLQAADDAAEMIQDAEDSAIRAQKAAQEAMYSVVNVVENTKNDLKVFHSGQPYRENVVEDVQKLIETDDIQESEEWMDVSTAPDLARFIDDEIDEEIDEGILEDEIVNNVEEIDEIDEIEELEEIEEPIQASAYREPWSDMEAMWSEDMEKEEPTDIEAEEKIDFKPISPRRVEIIHQPDGDYVADNVDDLSTSAAFASMGIFAPKSREAEEPRRRSRTRRSSRRDRMQDSAAAVDIQFVQGKDNGRNSNERILELHKAGKSNMAIAKELGLGLGEVKLVIDLFEGV